MSRRDLSEARGRAAASGFSEPASPWAPLLITALAAFVLALPLRGQDDDDEKVEAVEAQAGFAVVAQAFTDEHFEQWVFQDQGTASGARRRLDALLSLHLEAIDRTCKLSDEQKEKVRLSALRQAWSARADSIRAMDLLLAKEEARTAVETLAENDAVSALAAEKIQKSTATRRQNLERLRGVRRRAYEVLQRIWPGVAAVMKSSVNLDPVRFSDAL